MSLRKKHKDGKVYDVYPMELQRIRFGTQTVFDRNTRGKSWIIIDLFVESKFIPKNATGLITLDGNQFVLERKRIGKEDGQHGKLL